MCIRDRYMTIHTNDIISVAMKMSEFSFLHNTYIYVKNVQKYSARDMHIMDDSVGSILTMLHDQIIFRHNTIEV